MASHGKADDILLSVITDGRHAAIDMRFVLPDYEDEPGNKLNTMIANVHAIWTHTSDRRYTRPDGIPYALRGAAQMIFSDLGTLNVETTRGFSAYRWIKTRLVELGVPAAQIAFMFAVGTSIAGRPPGHRRRSLASGSHRTWRADFPHHALRQSVHSTARLCKAR
jgi:hypothetical protein